MEQEVKVKTRAHFDQIAADYDNSEDGSRIVPMYDDIMKLIAQAAPKSLLDVGCGTGNILCKLRDLNNGMQLYGLDLSETMIEVCRGRLDDSAQLVVGDAEQLPYGDESMDCVLCNASFHHYTKPDVVLEEMRRVIKPKGYLILGDPHAEGEVYVEINKEWESSDVGDYHMYCRQELMDILAKHGFEILAEANPTDMTIVFLTQKR